MTTLELKSKVRTLTPAQRRELNAFMISRRQETPEARRETARRIRAVKSGSFVTLEELEKRLARR
ncbi:MAG: hypothetical protein FJ399_04470 [Verrucomicrobia bacterium]|nr:hypothetical protein [Verrucomicrobiota bacterium]